MKCQILIMKYLFTVLYGFIVLGLNLTAVLFAHTNELNILFDEIITSCDEVMQIICFHNNYNLVGMK